MIPGYQVNDPDWQNYHEMQPTAWDLAFYGAEPYPADASGTGIEGGDIHGRYNPPHIVHAIWEKIKAFQMADPLTVVQFCQPDLDFIEVNLVEDQIADDIALTWRNLRTAYETAAGCGFGVSVEARE